MSAALEPCTGQGLQGAPIPGALSMAPPRPGLLLPAVTMEEPVPSPLQHWAGTHPAHPHGTEGPRPLASSCLGPGMPRGAWQPGPSWGRGGVFKKKKEEKDGLALRSRP